MPGRRAAPCSSVRRTTSLLLLALLSLHPLTAIGQEAEASPAPVDDPLALGQQALAAGKNEDALALFTRAYRWRPDAASAAGLAEAEDRLGSHRLAAEHFSIALSLLAAGEEPRKRELQARLLEQKRFVATVLVRVPGAAGVSLQVDDKAVGESPLRLPLYLEPGLHTLSAHAEGRVFAGVEITVQAGQIVNVGLRELEPRSAQPPEKPLWPTFVLAGLSAAGIGVGVGTLVVSLQREAEVEDDAASIDSCDPAALDQACANLASLVSERNALRNASTAGFVAGGVSLAAMVGYILVPWPTETPESTTRTAGARLLWAAPLLGPQRWGVALGGELW